ncbi:MAG TPA: DUF1801 domain-containing protein [Candidatus Nanopelagicales bacterium]|nr:DUF1801 domain-containing protein [Candidatus Nanopelagicales bacterium]
MSTMDEYVDGLPEASAAAVAEIRRRVHEAVPGAEETISYGMPTFTLDGRSFVHVAGWARHVSVYPLPALDAALEQEVAPYRSGASTLKLPLAQEIPYDLVSRLVALLAAQRA